MPEINPPRSSPQLGQNVRTPRVDRIPLDTAFENSRIQVPGGALFVVNSSGPSAYVLAAFNSGGVPRLKLSQGLVLSSFPFTDIYLTNDVAQPGGWIEIASTIPQPDIDVPPPYGAEPIALLHDSWRGSSPRFVGSVLGLAAGAGIHTAIRVSPIGTGTRVVRFSHINGVSTTGLVNIAIVGALVTEAADVSAIPGLINEQTTHNNRLVTIATANLPTQDFTKIHAAPLQGHAFPWGWVCELQATEVLYMWNTAANEAFGAEIAYSVLPVRS